MFTLNSIPICKTPSHQVVTPIMSVHSGKDAELVLATTSDIPYSEQTSRNKFILFIECFTTIFLNTHHSLLSKPSRIYRKGKQETKKNNANNKQ